MLIQIQSKGFYQVMGFYDTKTSDWIVKNKELIVLGDHRQEQTVGAFDMMADDKFCIMWPSAAVQSCREVI